MYASSGAAESYGLAEWLYKQLAFIMPNLTDFYSTCGRTAEGEEREREKRGKMFHLTDFGFLILSVRRGEFN